MRQVYNILIIGIINYNQQIYFITEHPRKSLSATNVPARYQSSLHIPTCIILNVYRTNRCFFNNSYLLTRRVTLIKYYIFQERQHF